MELLNRLNKWYQTHCDGSWEHMFGINLETMDNPGWELVVDLADTLLEDVEFQTIQRGDPEDSEGSWIHCFTEKSRYIGRGGIGDLDEIITIFLDWADRYTDTSPYDSLVDDLMYQYQTTRDIEELRRIFRRIHDEIPNEHPRKRDLIKQFYKIWDDVIDEAYNT